MRTAEPTRQHSFTWSRRCPRSSRRRMGWSCGTPWAIDSWISAVATSGRAEAKAGCGTEFTLSLGDLLVAKGPNSTEKLNGTRFTKGVSQSGQKFEFQDCWTKPGNAHRILDEPWIGRATFIAEDVATLLGVQCSRRGVQRPAGTTSLRWSDILA